MRRLLPGHDGRLPSDLPKPCTSPRCASSGTVLGRIECFDLPMDVILDGQDALVPVLAFSGECGCDVVRGVKSSTTCDSTQRYPARRTPGLEGGRPSRCAPGSKIAGCATGASHPARSGGGRRGTTSGTGRSSPPTWTAAHHARELRGPAHVRHALPFPDLLAESSRGLDHGVCLIDNNDGNSK